MHHSVQHLSTSMMYPSPQSGSTAWRPGIPVPAPAPFPTLLLPPPTVHELLPPRWTATLGVVGTCTPPDSLFDTAFGFLDFPDTLPLDPGRDSTNSVPVSIINDLEAGYLICEYNGPARPAASVTLLLGKKNTIIFDGRPPNSARTRRTYLLLT